MDDERLVAEEREPVVRAPPATHLVRIAGDQRTESADEALRWMQRERHRQIRRQAAERVKLEEADADFDPLEEYNK